MNKFTNTITLACFFMALTVALGAFGAHVLKNLLNEYELSIFETGIKYQFYHSLGLFAIAFCRLQIENRWMGRAQTSMILGMVFFSGSLYLLAISGIKWMGAVAPIGGGLMIASWVMLAIAVKVKLEN